MISVLLKFLVGVVFSITLVFVGFRLTNILEHGFWIVLSIILVPLLACFLFKSRYKDIGISMLIITIPIVILGVLFIMISHLH